MLKVKVLMGLVSVEVSLPGLPTAAFSLCAHVILSLCMHIPPFPCASSSS